MNKNSRIIFAALVAGAIVLTPPAHAVEPFAHVASYGFQFAGMSRGVRNIGMGSTGTAAMSGFPTGFFNPASLAWAAGWTLQGSYETWPADLSLSDFRFSGGYPPRDSITTGAWRFGGSIGYSGFWMPPQEERTIFRPEGTGQTFDEDDHMGSATAAAAWTHRAVSVGAGGTVKYLKTGRYLSTWAFDMGAIIAFPIEWEEAVIRPRAGLSIQNLDTGAFGDSRDVGIENRTRSALGIDVITPRVRVGKGAWTRDVSLLAISFDFDWVDREASQNLTALGIEVAVVGAVQLRVGTLESPYGESETDFGFGLGWDVGRWLVQFDYARVDASMFPGFDLDRDVFSTVVGARW